jgi:Flp pilus assembly protein TadB
MPFNPGTKNKGGHSERSEEPTHFVFAVVLAVGLAVAVALVVAVALALVLVVVVAVALALVLVVVVAVALPHSTRHKRKGAPSFASFAKGGNVKASPASSGPCPFLF